MEYISEPGRQWLKEKSKIQRPQNGVLAKEDNKAASLNSLMQRE